MRVFYKCRLLVSVALACAGCLVPAIAQDQDSGFFNPDYKQALLGAQQQGRPVFVEITEHG